MDAMDTSLESLWRGPFGDAYHARSPGSVPANVALFARILSRTGPIRSVIELGCGVGANLQAIGTLLPECKRLGVEINEAAASEARKWGDVALCSLLSYVPLGPSQLAFTKGVLIHIDPAYLPLAYDVLSHCAGQYALIAEYFSPHPRAIPYRGHDAALWARDFGGEFLDRHAQYFRLLDYGFVSKRDTFPQDDLTWWLMERR